MLAGADGKRLRRLRARRARGARGPRHVLPGVTTAGRGHEIAGFVWWQGHKDRNAAHAARYEQNETYFEVGRALGECMVAMQKARRASHK